MTWDLVSANPHSSFNLNPPNFTLAKPPLKHLSVSQNMPSFFNLPREIRDAIRELAPQNCEMEAPALPVKIESWRSKIGRLEIFWAQLPDGLI
jgi:hypothetical protein